VSGAGLELGPWSVTETSELGSPVTKSVETMVRVLMLDSRSPLVPE
jgi:hypothetical protein